MFLETNPFKQRKSSTIITNAPQTYLEISASAFNHNVSYYKNKIGLHNSLAIVIKGNGYGHGLQQMAALCEQNPQVDWVCVAQLSEALALENFNKPILVLGYSDINPELAVRKNIHFMVDHLEYAQKLNAIGKQYSYQFNVHVKVDTGLSRVGIAPQETDIFVTELEKLDHVHIAGVYSHFASSDSDPEFTKGQFARYNAVITQLHDNGIFPSLLHMSNTASVSNLEYPSHCNFFRIGLGAYGFGPDQALLQPVMTWKTHIVHIKTVSAGSYIGYSATDPVERSTRLALLPIGYYDGYDFRFSNKTCVMINGTYAPILGRVAMNMCIVDITDIFANTGDEVILIGGDEKIHVHTLAQAAHIANVREIITGINVHIERIVTE
jgi:alanine racemase